MSSFLQNNRRPNILLSCLLLIVFMLASTPLYAASPAKSNILIIFSWHKSLPWEIELEKGFKLQYEGMSAKPNLFYEYMDAGRFRSRDQLQAFRVYLQEKYSGYPLNTVVFEGPPAARLLMSSSGLFKNSRKYILNPGPLEAGISSNESTIISANINYKGVVNSLLQLSPGKTVYLVAGATKSGQERIQLVVDLISMRDPHRKIVLLNNLSMGKLLEKVATLNPKNSVIFFLLFGRDIDGASYIPFEVAQQLSKQATAPVYSAWSTLMGSGVVGGYLFSGEMVGKLLASIVNNPARIKLMDPKLLTDQTHAFFYDWRQLKRWNISEKSLQPGSKIFYKEPTFYELYSKEVIVSALALIFIISFLWILWLRKEIGVRRVAEENLQDSENRFRSLSDAAFEGILILDKGKILDANNSAAKMFGYSFNHLVGMDVVDLVSPENRDEVESNLCSYGPDESYEFSGVNQDGVQFPVETHTKMYRLKGQQVRVVAVRDLTEKKKAEEEIRTLKGILPICSYCKEIRDDKGYWSQIESYIAKYSNAEFSHSICPTCADKYFPDDNLYDD